jgi:hypothetical protein
MRYAVQAFMSRIPLHQFDSLLASWSTFGLDLLGLHAIMLTVGSANVSLLAVLLGRLAAACFGRTSWRAATFGPFLSSPESQTSGL